MSAKRPKENLPAVRHEDGARVHQVFQWILAGQTEHHIREAISATWPDAEAMPLIAAAIVVFERAGEFTGNVVTGWCFEAYRDLYRRMLEVGDFTGALRAVKMIQNMAKG